jgi:hypothetical protein
MISLLIALVGADNHAGTGYTPASAVTEHFKIDLDQKVMETACDEAKWADAIEIYSNGANSKKSSGLRTIQGFSTALKDGRPKLRGEPYYDMYAEYWKSHSYASDIVMAALEGTGSFHGKEDIFRGEVANKGAQYIVTWQYVVHEIEDAMMDCAAGDDTANDRGVKAWDEGWAFWTGSTEMGECGDGMGGYQLAQKRCQNFGTCDTTTCEAASNAKMLRLFKPPQAGCSAGPTRGHIDCIVKEMTVPLVQGALRYAYKVGKRVAADDTSEKFAKEWGEGWAFLAAVLPRVDHCDPCAAALLRENMDAGVPTSLVMKDGYEKFRTALRSTFECLGVTCEDIGTLAEAVDTFPSESSCSMSETGPECSTWTVAGYIPATGVTSHAMIDLDHQIIDRKSDEADWAAVEEIYTTGFNSEKSSGMRTIQGFSTATLDDGSPKLAGEPFFDLYAEYYNSSTYGDDIVMAALKGTGAYADRANIFRAEVVNKCAQYMVTWMYVIHELEDSRMDCEAGDQTLNDRGVHAWDEGWVFYAGSQEGVDGCGSGYSSYQLAQKRCANFGTCHYSHRCDYAASNSAMLKIYEEVRVGCSVGPKREHIDEIVRLMTIPLIQGSIRYAYKLSKHEDRMTDKFEKEWGEGFAFLSAVIPQIDKCDEDAAALLMANMGVEVPIADIMKDGYEKYRDAIRSTYKCLGITCTDIGELDAAVEGGVATESTCTCAAYDGCDAPDAGPGRWWTIKEASDYSELVPPTSDTCTPLYAEEVVEEDDPDPTPAPTPKADPTPAPTAKTSYDDPTSFAGALSLLLALGSM